MVGVLTMRLICGVFEVPTRTIGNNYLGTFFIKFNEEAVDPQPIMDPFDIYSAIYFNFLSLRVPTQNGNGRASSF